MVTLAFFCCQLKFSKRYILRNTRRTTRVTTTAHLYGFDFLAGWYLLQAGEISMDEVNFC